MGKTVAIVQARMGSQRFPGKMLAKLDGVEMLKWVLLRTVRSKNIDEVVLATSDKPQDDALIEMALKLEVGTFRGSEDDVLGRFVGASVEANADIVVRICADNPFVDPDELDRLVTYFAQNDCQYSCNHQERRGSKYADGFGAEIVDVGTLLSIGELAQDTGHREHVTKYIWDHPSDYIIMPVPAPSELAYPNLRFDVDLPADLVKLNRLCEIGITLESTAEDIVSSTLRSLSIQTT